MLLSPSKAHRTRQIVFFNRLDVYRMESGDAGFQRAPVEIEELKKVVCLSHQAERLADVVDDEEKSACPLALRKRSNCSSREVNIPTKLSTSCFILLIKTLS